MSQGIWLDLRIPMTWWNYSLSDAEKANQLVGFFVGVLSSSLVTIGFFVLDKVFPDFWHRMSFRRPAHRILLHGKGIRVDKLRGRYRSAEGDSMLSLKDHFPAAMPFDTYEYEVLDVEIRTRRNNAAALIGHIRWKQGSDLWTASISGRGIYFPKDEKDFNGYVYVICDCVGAPVGGRELTWKVVYGLRPKADITQGWTGFWIMFDKDVADHGKFGTFDLRFKR